MLKIVREIKNKSGLHARPAKNFVNTIKGFDSDVFISAKGKRVNGKSIIGVMSLGATKGVVVEVEINGVDEKLVEEKVEELFNCNFYEE